MFVREYRIHLINGEVIRVGEGAEKEDHAPILDQFLHTEESGFLDLCSVGGPHAYIPVRNILYLSIYPVPDR